jgi:hypothetical protein
MVIDKIFVNSFSVNNIEPPIGHDKIKNKMSVLPCLDDSDEWLRKSYPKTHPRGLKMVLRAVLHSKGRVEQLNIKIKLPTRRKCEYSGRDGWVASN